jgi:histidine triad (HIT) family protein
MDCIFCQIVAGKIPSEIIYQDEELIAFRDINPQAPTHLLIIPKKHIPSLAQLSQAELPLMGRMVTVANKLAKEEGIAETGYRLVLNYGEWGGQVVPHLHMHLIGGRRLSGKIG